MPQRATNKRSSKSNKKSAEQRLQRLLASAGFGSRRQCEELIESGRVHVDNELVTKAGINVDPAVHKIKVDGVLLKAQKLVYFAVNKPVGVVTTNRDPHGRPRVVDLVPPDERVFPVGRLDRSSEGLILLTNDGELAQRLTHPKFGIRKIYRVIVAGKVEPETMRKMREGIHIAEGFVRVDGAKLLKAKSKATELEIVLREGKNREIRRILARFGHKVQQLRRIAVGPLRLGDIPAGAYRTLRREEIEKLWTATDTAEKVAAIGAPKKPGKKKTNSAKVRSNRAGPPRSGSKLTKKSTSRSVPAVKKSTDKPTGKSVAKPSRTPASTPTVGAVIGGDAPEPKSSKGSGKRKAGKGKAATHGKRATKRRNRK